MQVSTSSLLEVELITSLDMITFKQRGSERLIIMIDRRDI